jgi:peptidase E
MDVCDGETFQLLKELKEKQPIVKVKQFLFF